jgi:hypothetical protein
MSSEVQKGDDEIRAFREFLARARLPIDPDSVEKRPAGEPDLLCVHAEEGPIAFELARICDETVAKVLAAGAKATTEAFWTSDPSAALVRQKLKKSYTTPYPIELLVYTDGRVITPDDVILPMITPIFESRNGPYRRAWFMGEHETCLVWQAS